LIVTPDYPPKDDVFQLAAITLHSVLQLTTDFGHTQIIMVEVENVQNRLDELKSSFKGEFLSEDDGDGYEAQLTAAQYMQGAFILYSLGLNGSAIIEIYGIFERISLWYVAQLSQLPLQFLERHTLPDFAQALKNFQVLDEQDVKFLGKLANLRNSLAHKNPDKLANAAFSGRAIGFLDIDIEMAKYPILPLINDSIRCLKKITDHYDRVKKVSDNSNSPSPTAVNWT